MTTINIPNTRAHQKFINQIIQMVKLENLEQIVGEEKVNYDEQYSYIEFSSKDHKQWETFSNLLPKVSDKTYSRISYE